MTILVASDGSPPSRAAVERARALARAAGADLRVVPVLGSAAAAAVCARAAADGADLIVVAGTPRWGGRLRLLGSVAEEIACRAPCSVLVERLVPEPGMRTGGDEAAGAGPREIRSVLVAVDFSPPSGAALVRALALARAVGARVDVLHVLSPAPPPGGGVRVSGRPRPGPREAMELLEDWTSPSPGRRAPVGTYLRRGAAGPAIARFAREGSYDLLVVGGGGEAGEPAASLGGVAQELLWRAPCPVVVVRERAAGGGSAPASRGWRAGSAIGRPAGSGCAGRPESVRT